MVLQLTRTVCFVLAAVCFFLKGFNVPVSVDLMSIGFGFVMVGVIVG